MYLHGRLALAELLIRLHDRCTCDAYGTCTPELIRRAAGAFGPGAALAAIFAHPSWSSAPAAALHRMIVPMVPRLPGLSTPTAPGDSITLHRPAIPCPATLPSDRQLDRRPNSEWHGGMLCLRRWAKSASLLANSMLGALQQYCETTCGCMLHDMRPLCTAFQGPRAWTWPRSHKEQMQCGEEHAVKPPILQCARAVPCAQTVCTCTGYLSWQNC